MRVAPPVTIDKSQRETLQQWVRSRSLPARQIERARIVLLAAGGKTVWEMGLNLKISNKRPACGGRGFRLSVLAALQKEPPLPGGNPAISAKLKEELIRRTTQSKPAN